MKTTKEMIEVMEWFSKGGEVEWVAVGCNDWERVIKPCWNWNNFDYRIKEFQYPMGFKDKQSIPKPIEEGTRNRSGVNPNPSSSRPNFTPPAMKPKNTEIEELEKLQQNIKYSIEEIEWALARPDYTEFYLGNALRYLKERP